MPSYRRGRAAAVVLASILLGVAIVLGGGGGWPPGKKAFSSGAGFGPPVSSSPEGPSPALADSAARLWKLPIEVVGEGGFVRGGIPFPKGRLAHGAPVRLTGGGESTTPAIETLATWGDGTVRWLLVEFPVEGAGFLLEPGVAEAPAGDPPVPPVPAEGRIVLRIDGAATDLAAAEWTVERQTPWSSRARAIGTTTSGLVWRARIERRAGESGERLRLELRNPTPTGSRNGQPDCMTLDCPGAMHLGQVSVMVDGSPARVRWAEENGAKDVPGGVALLPKPSQLRPGEQFGWEIVIGDPPLDPPLLEYNAPWGCRSDALGPLTPVDFERWSDYERNNVTGVAGLRRGRARPHWRNPREHGEDQRDWDGGVIETDFQTHNNEYETLLTYAKQRLRTMGRHDTSRDWQYLGVTGARHFANVDIYHVHEGPLPFMHGAAFQHVKHGGSGQSTMHRSTFAPNMQHQTGRGLLAWYFLTGDPLLLESFREIAENTRWRVLNGPGMPGISNTHGEERAPAMALGLMTDAWSFTRDPSYLAAARQIVDESHARTKKYVSSPDATDWRCKPWMITLLVVTLDEFQEAVVEYGDPSDGVKARESSGLFKTFLRRTVVHDPVMTHLPYQFSNDPAQMIDATRDSWSVVAADALCDFYPDVAEVLLRSGSRVIWYPEHPVGKYAKVLNHVVMSGWGHRTMRALEDEPR